MAVDSKGRTVFAMTGKWKKLRLMLDPDLFHAKLEANIRRATQLNALLVVREIRKRIQGNVYSPNAGLTIALKGSSKPLIGPGDNELFKSVTHEMVDAFSAFVGVLRSAKTGEGKPMVDVAQAVHEGISIEVSAKMRGLFLVLSEYTQGNLEQSELSGRAAEIAKTLPSGTRIRPLKPSTTQIVIPPRPFIRAVFEDEAIKKRIQANWMKAVKSAIKGEG